MKYFNLLIARFLQIAIHCYIASLHRDLRELSHKALGYTFITDVARIKVFTAMSHERRLITHARAPTFTHTHTHTHTNTPIQIPRQINMTASMLKVTLEIYKSLLAITFNFYDVQLHKRCT